MYSIGLKHNGVLIASKELSQKETTNLIEGHLTYIVILFKTIYKFDIGEYRLSEYEIHRDYFFIHIRTEDLEKIRDYKLTELGL